MDPEGIGARIRSRREGLGLTVEGAACNMGVSRQTLGRWESGERVPQLAMLDPVSKVLQCPVGWLLGETPPPQAVLDCTGGTGGQWVEERPGLWVCAGEEDVGTMAIEVGAKPRVTFTVGAWNIEGAIQPSREVMEALYKAGVGLMGIQGVVG